MKKNKVFLLVLIMAVFACCQSEDVYNEEAKSSISTIDSEWGTFKTRMLVPLKIDERNNMLEILFLASPKAYSLNLNSKDALMYSKILHEALYDRVPVKFNVDENNDFITKLRVTTDVERIEYNEKTSELQDIVALRSTSPVSPQNVNFNNYDEAYQAAIVAFNFIKVDAQKENINFSYIGDGCQARAHKMKKILQSHNYYILKKIFAYPDSRNNFTLAGSNGECCVYWGGFHVAILIQFSYLIKPQWVGWGPEYEVLNAKFVIDPGLFDRPVTEAEWKDAITNNSCRGTSKTIGIHHTSEVDVEYFYFYPEVVNGKYGFTDPYYSQTDSILKQLKEKKGCNPYWGG